MGLYERLEGDMKAALKGGDAMKLSVLRMLVSAVKVFEIEKNTKRVEDPEIVKILTRQIKQHKESIGEFEKGLREDLAAKEKAELKILEAYMPEQMSEAEIAKIVKDAIAETGAVSKSDLGKVMKAVMEKAKGRADGKIINQIAMGLLK